MEWKIVGIDQRFLIQLGDGAWRLIKNGKKEEEEAS